MSVALPQTELTEQGDQMLVAGVAPVTPRDRLRLRALAPMAPRALQKPCDSGLFDLAARNQLDLFSRR